MTAIWWVAVVGVALAIPAPAAEPGDARIAAGRALFDGCAACHGADGEGTDLAPAIRGIVGQPAASQPGFAYSGAMRRSGKVWTVDALQAFLTDPQAAVPGTRMAFPGVSPDQAAALAAYLANLR